MPTDYNQMIEDYFEVNNFSKTSIDLGSDCITLSIEVNGEKQEFTVEQASKHLAIEPKKVESFLVVHCCLSNQLDLLIDDREYKFWEISNNQLTVEFLNATQETYFAHDIVRLMEITSDCDWSFEGLKRTASELKLL